MQLCMVYIYIYISAICTPPGTLERAGCKWQTYLSSFATITITRPIRRLQSLIFPIGLTQCYLVEQVKTEVMRPNR